MPGRPDFGPGSTYKYELIAPNEPLDPPDEPMEPDPPAALEEPTMPLDPAVWAQVWDKPERPRDLQHATARGVVRSRRFASEDLDRLVSMIESGETPQLIEPEEKDPITWVNPGQPGMGEGRR